MKNKYGEPKVRTRVDKSFTMVLWGEYSEAYSTATGKNRVSERWGKSGCMLGMGMVDVRQDSCSTGLADWDDLSGDHDLFGSVITEKILEK